MMRKRFAFLAVLALVLSILPWYALADDGFSGSDGGSFSDSDGGVVYTAYGDNDTYKVYVRADNKWQAAVYACGGDPSLLSSEIRSKLSDPSYGGDFYAYAQTFEVMDNPLEFPPWVLFSLPFFSNISDYMKSEVSNSFYTSALVDYKVVLAGGDVSGGGSGGGGSVEVPEGQQVIEMRSANFRDSSGNAVAAMRIYAYEASYSDGVLTTTGNRKYISAWHNSYYVSGSRMYVAPEVVESAYSYVNSGYDVVFVSSFDGFNGSQFNSVLTGFVYGHDITISDAVGSDGAYGNRIFGSDLHLIFFESSPYYYDSSGVFCFSYGTVSVDRVVNSPVNLPFSSVSIVYGVENPPPAGDWPEPTAPVTPDPPEVPTPTAPTETVDPNPTAPTITWPTSPTLVLPTAPVVETTPDGIDYTALLTLINDNLNSIDAYLQNFYSSFNSFRSDFLNGVDDIVDGLRNIYQYLGHLNNILEVHCKHITDQIEESVYNLELYLKRLFEWLPEQLDFDAQYDDSSVVSWLKQIYSKLGGGTYAPNPVADPGGFFEWLGGLVSGFLASLLAGLPGKVQELVSDVTDLTDYFPFSAPWDLYALLLLFAHDPVTPVFNIPWGMGGGHTVNVVVDCTQWDGVMAIVRSVQKIIFAGGLAKLTFDMFRPTDVMGD